MQEYHRKQQKSPIDAHARIMGSLQPRTRRPRRRLYVLFILLLIIAVPSAGSAVGPKLLSEKITPDRQYGGQSAAALPVPINGCSCANASPAERLSRPADLRDGNTARWRLVLPASVLSRIGASSSTRDARCLISDAYACLSRPTSPRTSPPSAAEIDQRNIQLFTPHNS